MCAPDDIIISTFYDFNDIPGVDFLGQTISYNYYIKYLICITQKHDLRQYHFKSYLIFHKLGMRDYYNDELFADNVQTALFFYKSFLCRQFKFTHI